MRFTISTVLFLLISSFVKGQNTGIKWYSESENNGLIIQNSLPKGGKYSGLTKNNFNYSYLVFFTRVINKTENPLEIKVNFPADSIAIPNSPNTFLKLFLPQDAMTLEKEKLFSYGITELESLDSSIKFHKKINPKEDCLFYVVAIFYQTRAGEWNHERGGNRAELVLEGQNLFYKMPPQINSLRCGNIIFNNKG